MLEIFGRENFGEFGDLLQIRPSFIRQLLVISEKAIGAGLKFAKVFFAKCSLASYSPKFSLTKISAVRYYHLGRAPCTLFYV